VFTDTWAKAWGDDIIFKVISTPRASKWFGISAELYGSQVVFFTFETPSDLFPLVLATLISNNITRLP
jgi:hypothetical protein